MVNDNEIDAYNISTLIDKIDDLQTRIEILEAANAKSVFKRISFMTWYLTNPLNIIILPVLITLGIEIIINNWNIPFENWSPNSLTNGLNWTIPVIVAIIGFTISFGNKIYLIIQEKGDMDLVKVLDAKINGLNRRLEREQAKRDQEYKEAEAKRVQDLKEYEAKRDQELKEYKEQRDQEFKILLESLKTTNTKVAVIESKLEK